MAEHTAAIVQKVSWLATDDKQHVLMKWDQGEPGTDIVLAMKHETLLNSVSAMLSALSVFASPKMAGGSTPVLKAVWFEFGRSAAGDVILNLRLEGGGSLYFALPPGMAEQMAEVLQTMIGSPANTPTPGTTTQ